MGYAHRKHIRFVSLREGALHDPKEAEPFEILEGVFAGCTRYFDAGNPKEKIVARHRLEIDIVDGDVEYVVQTTLATEHGQGVTGGWMLASYLHGVQPGEACRLSCGTADNDKVTTAWLWVSNGQGGWVIAERKPYPKDPAGRFEAAVADIDSHPGYHAPRFKKGGPSTADTVDKCPAEREFWGLTIAMGWPSPVNQREDYVVFLSRELKRNIADFEDVSPRDWANLVKVAGYLQNDPAKWPPAFQPTTSTESVPSREGPVTQSGTGGVLPASPDVDVFENPPYVEPLRVDPNGAAVQQPNDKPNDDRPAWMLAFTRIVPEAAKRRDFRESCEEAGVSAEAVARHAIDKGVTDSDGLYAAIDFFANPPQATVTEGVV
jgi:hypothetical protein